ncbi:MAG: excinuclease ABC subunit UvrA [Phycisphaerae bacterium]|nr:MAG: excinuclease ABC subunit A [Planctomycetota bacterium]KAB2950101.1 MAG: excinuclease ABC subunit A [Phycisphaerae bacterium]MBE7456434.1 excinuclease ABC subunit UvrA [Planctomycetia bacterium]MCK6465357.1 excinuclease ABC subunit UvrA [Phycisphaerae bacterium]MCL4719266.1 excinuclease ABC subunit UvrA [Phycisphaerae bacterium]
MNPDRSAIEVRGAREHNLQDVSVTLPWGRLICMTGVSGSGKSSLAFDTLFAEGQRRYIESLSAYARQFLTQVSKPDVDGITGLSPSVAIQQKTSGWNPRSTVGTITQAHDFLRVLFARIGESRCPKCDRPIRAQSRDQMLARLLPWGEGAAVLVMAPIARKRKGEFRDVFDDLRRQGFARARVDGAVVSLSDPPKLAKNQRHDVDVVIDRLTIREDARMRLAEAIEHALRIGQGTLVVHRSEEGRGGADAGGAGNDLILSSEYSCATCGISLEAPTPQTLSFNSPQGMCPRCDGLGRSFDFDPDLLVPDPDKSFLDGAVEPMRGPIGRWRRHIFRSVAQHVGFDLKAKWRDLSAAARNALLFGTGDAHLTFEWRTRGGVFRHGGTFDGVVADLMRSYRKATSAMVRSYYEKYMREQVCPQCRGARIGPQGAAIRLGGRTLPELCAMSVDQLAEFVDGLTLGATERTIAEQALRELRLRLRFLQDVGLNYLTLDRAAPTLSGGESQRIRLASQIGAGLTGVLYILDEPSIGLHPRDNRRLLDSLKRLRDQGNTVIVVEHDEETMRESDYLVDFGPGPGVRGGRVVASGGVDAVCASAESVTGAYLSGRRRIEVPKRRRPVERTGKIRSSRRTKT